MTQPNPPVQTYKAMLWDYDYLLAKSDDECSYCLSEREVQIILAQLDYIGWKTRYKPTSTEIDLSTILRWQGNLARKLMSGCCGDDEAIHRYLPDGTYQSSDDDGASWEDDPTGDPRHGAILAPPLPGSPGDALRCAAADNVRDQYLLMRNNTVDLLTAGTTLLAIVAGLVALIGSILAISVVGISFGVILFGLSAALLNLTPASVEAQIDAVALNVFRCIIYCHLDVNGRVKVGEFDDILADIADQFADFPESFFYSITASMGATGINNAATMGTSTAADCGDCDCPDLTCNDKWSAEFGTILGTFDGYLRVESIVDGGTSKITLKTDSSNECCALLDCRVLEPAGVNPFLIGVHINCGDPQTFPFLQFSLGLGGCYNYVGTQLSNGDTRTYIVEFLFDPCP